MRRDLWGWFRKVWTFGQIIRRDTGTIPIVEYAACLVECAEAEEIITSCAE